MLGIGINYFDRRIFKFLSCSFSFFVLSFFLPSFLPMEGWLSHSWAYQMLLWYSPLWRSLPVLGTASPPGTVCAWGKAALPRTGCQKTTKGQASCPLSGWPQVPSGVPGVLFPFFREDITSSPSEHKRLPPSGENPKTHGAPAGQDSVPQGGSQGRAQSALKIPESHPKLSTQVS